LKRSFGQSPYHDEDFVYEGNNKVEKFCEVYVNGTVCPDGNRCLNSHRCKWDDQLAENKHEEKMFGKIKDSETEEVDHSMGSEGPTSKRPRVKMMRSEGNPTQEDVDQRISGEQDVTKKTERKTQRTHRPIPQERNTMS
jgi:hypothetical protein